MAVRNPLRFTFHHLYLFQLEEYNIVRYINLMLKTKGVPRSAPRKKLVWTPKAILIFALSLTLQFLTAYWIVAHLLHLPFILMIIPFIFLMYISFVFLILASILLFPIDYVLKRMVVNKAKKKLAGRIDLIVIGIAGSYGKTTMKETVATILAQKFTILKTPENINTPLGIARLITQKLDAKTEILIVEMGEYKQGDIKEICHLVKPNIAVMTGINEAHLERMQDIQTTKNTIFEIVHYMDPNGLVILNGDDTHIQEEYKPRMKDQKVFLYHAQNKMQVKSQLLGEYAKGTIQGAAAVATYLGMNEEEIEKGVQLLRPLPHRLQPIEGVNGTLVIDDSYNGNPDGVREAIKVLASYTDRRKIYITPGLVEAGKKTEEIHYNIGKQLAVVADSVVLIRNSVTPFIEKGLIENGFDKKKIVWFGSTEQAHSSLGTIVKSGDVVLFQNDWPDNYL